MFQMMLALQIRRRAGMGQILGYRLPEWNLVSPPVVEDIGVCVILKNQIFDLDNVAYLLRTGVIQTAVVNGWGMRLPYFGAPALYRDIFKAAAGGDVLQDDELLVHIRGEDILSGWHHLYFPMPFSFYESVIESTGLRPVFMGQIDQSRYAVALRKRFPRARFLPMRSAVEDFTTLRNAHHVVLSVSSYAWLATWLSEAATHIHLPVAGLYDPRNRETQLLPIGDPRYTFYKASMPTAEARKTIDFMSWVEQTTFDGILSFQELQEIVLAPMHRTVVAASPPTNERS